MLATDAGTPPADYHYPAWSVRPASNGWLLYENGKAPRHFARRSYNTGNDSQLRREDDQYATLTLLDENGRAWLPCRPEGTWQPAARCEAEQAPSAAPPPAPVAAAGLTVTEFEPYSPATGRGRIQVRFANGRATAMHVRCDLVEPWLACADLAPREDYRNQGASERDLYEGRPERFILYRITDGEVQPYPGTMATLPAACPEGACAIVKTTELLQYFQRGSLAYELECRAGVPVLHDANGRELWRWQPRQPGLYGTPPERIRQLFNWLGY